jgi:hypothetical protein
LEGRSESSPLRFFEEFAMFLRLLIAAVLLVLPTFLLAARQPADDAPPPEQPDQPVVGNVQPVGWGLQGAQGRLYFFGGIAMADYTWQNRHRVVSLAEEPATEQADPKFLYYRELGDGHRWAVAKSADRDRTYAIYFQPRGQAASTRARWALFERARLVEDSRFPEDRRAASSGADTPPSLEGAPPAARRGASPIPNRDPILSRPEVVVEYGYAPCCGQ